MSIPLLCDAIGEYLREELNIATIPSSKINLYTVNSIERVLYTDLLKLFSKQERIQLTPSFKLLLERQNIVLRELCKLIYNKMNAISELEFNVGVNFAEHVQDHYLAVEELTNLQDCFRGLKVLEYSGSSNILHFFANHCTKIESLKLLQVTCENFEKDDLDHNSVGDAPLVQLISAQRNLRNLEFYDWKIFPSLTISSQTANSLRSVKLINCNFCKSKPLWPLSKCQNLEEITIRENYNFDERLLVPLTKVEFSNLRSFVYQYQLNNFMMTTII